jgi:signal transduction histidine kinase/ActR/RegA family two-component response regulator
MKATRSAVVVLSDHRLRSIAMTALGERGYEVLSVAPDQALSSVRAADLALMELGDRGLRPSDLLVPREARLMSLGKPVLVVVDPAHGAEVGAALAAGATGLVAAPFDAARLHVHLAHAEAWAAECSSFQRVIEQLPNRIMVFDKDGRLVFVNVPEGRGALSELLAVAHVDQLSPALRDAVMETVSRSRESGAPCDHEVEVPGAWCRLRVVPLAGDGFALVAMDITEHRRAEAELRASITKATALVDALPDMVFRISAEGVYLDFRAERVELLAVPPNQIIGRSLRELHGLELAENIQGAMKRALATGEMQRFEYQLETTIGTREFEARILASGSNEVVSIVRDMTETKLLQARLGLAERLAALGTLSAGVAHEINNPLTYILIGIESVLKELRRRRPDEPIGDRLNVLIERLHGAMEGARRVRRIVSDLRTFARADEEEERLIDPRVVLDAAAAMVDSHIRYRARLLRDYKEVPPILGNHDRLVQVFVNLLLNAAQAVHEGQARRNFIRLATRTDSEGRVVIEVEDSGEGIPSTDLGQIFDPFFTTKPIGEGTGLGLWVCHSIVTGHGGSITVDSGLGEGTTFRVVLPAASQPIESDGDRDEDDLLVPLHGRILIIDDDEQVAHSLAILFEGSDLTVVSSGREALDRLATGAEFDWIFCDLMMPDLSGMDVYEEVRRGGSGLERRFVFMTGGIFTPRARDFVAGVPNPCLSKPFHPRQVVAVLRQAAPGMGPRRPPGG